MQDIAVMMQQVPQAAGTSITKVTVQRTWDVQRTTVSPTERATPNAFFVV